MMTRAFIYLIRTIALIVLGWLPFHLGNTGNDQPQSPTWDMVDQPPHLQVILGYTNKTLWYPFRISNPLLSPWVTHNESYVMYVDYETPWITERLEADSCKSLLPFILASGTRREGFKQEIIKPEIPQYIKNQCLFESLASIGLSDDFMTTPKKVFGKPFDGETSKPYGIGLLNMHALLKFFTSNEAGDLKVIPNANTANPVRVAVVDGQKLYYSSSLDDTTPTTRHYPMFHYVNDANASFNDPPGHSFSVSQVLFSPNTTNRASNGDPIDRNPFIVGAVYSSQLMHRQAWIRNDLPDASSLR